MGTPTTPRTRTAPEGPPPELVGDVERSLTLPARSLSIAIVGSRGYPSTYGGFETLVRRLSPFLCGHGHDVTVYTRGSLPGRAKTAEIDGITCVRTAGVDSTSASTLTHGFTASLHASAKRFDVALVLNVANGFYLPLLRRAGVRTVVNVDGVEWARDKWGHVARRVLLQGARMTASYADEIVTDSVRIREMWQEDFGRRGTYIPYGADVIQPCTRSHLDRLGLPENYVLAVARLVPENNVEVLLDALELLGPSVPAVVVGSGTARGDGLTDRLSSLQSTRRNFRWLGHVSDQTLLMELWSHCAAYFHGHSVGGTNPALLQAMGCGSPVIALDSPYNREVLDGAGLVAPGRPAEVARLVETCLQDSRLRARLSALGRQRVAAAYRWSDVCAAYERTLVAAATRALGSLPARAGLAT